MSDDAIIPDVLARDPRFAPLAQATQRLTQLGTDPLLVYLIEQVDARLLPELVRQFHIAGHEGGSLATTEAQRRELVRQAIALHQKKGTLWAVRRALEPVGVHVNIIERSGQRAAYAKLNPHLLNGAWRLDGIMRLRALDRQTYIPQIQHWAQFIVRVNLAELQDTQALSLIKTLVNEWKPVSRHAIWQLWLALVAQHHLSASANLRTSLSSTRLFPWQNSSLSNYADASWRLGRGAVPARLDGRPFGFVLGAVYGAVSGYRLRHGRVGSQVSARLPTLAAPVGRPEYLPIKPIVPVVQPERLFWRRRRIDGSWRLTAKRLDGTERVGAAGFRLWGQRLFDCHRIDGSWRLGVPTRPSKPVHLRLSGMWRLGGARTPVFEVRSI